MNEMRQDSGAQLGQGQERNEESPYRDQQRNKVEYYQPWQVLLYRNNGGIYYSA